MPLSEVYSKIIKLPGLIIIRSFDGLVALFANNEAVLNGNEVPFYASLQSFHHVILNEYKTALEQRNLQSIKDFFRGDYYPMQDDRWKAMPIILFNYIFQENAANYPETLKFIKKIPGCCGVMISVLEPGKYIPPHKGIYKGVYRCLYVLEMEKEGDCWIKINDKKYFFREGEGIFFDETATHEVQNSSNAPRVALFLDIYRKLPFPLNVLNKIIFMLLRKSPFVMNILNRYNKLDKITINNFTPAEALL